MVLTTVGWGEKAPDTVVGQLIGGLCALLGVFIIALPVPIIVNSFTENYKNRVWKGHMLMQKQNRNSQHREKLDSQGQPLTRVDQRGEKERINGKVSSNL